MPVIANINSVEELQASNKKGISKPDYSDNTNYLEWNLQWNNQKTCEMRSKLRKTITSEITSVSDLTLKIADDMISEWVDYNCVEPTLIEEVKVNIAKELYKLLK